MEGSDDSRGREGGASGMTDAGEASLVCRAEGLSDTRRSDATAILMQSGEEGECMGYNDDNHDNRHNHDNDTIPSGFR
jgi:hypothetical protein